MKNIWIWIKNLFHVTQTNENKKNEDEKYLITKMTNWQNHQWQGSGGSKKTKDLQKFANLQKVGK